MKNLGKRFEEEFKRSVPDDCWYYRFKDSASSYYGGNQGLRFSVSNIADNLIYHNGHLYLNELKHHKGKSIPLSCIEGNKTKEKQIKELVDASMNNSHIHSNIIIFLSDCEKCYSLDIMEYLRFKRCENRKSIPVEYLEENGIEFPVSKIRTTYKLNFNNFLEKCEN